MSHIDTWDPKPDVPAERRSPFKNISTSVAGIGFTELLFNTSKHADKLTIVRCMTQPTPGIGNSHPIGSQYVFSCEVVWGIKVFNSDTKLVTLGHKGCHART